MFGDLTRVILCLRIGENGQWWTSFGARGERMTNMVGSCLECLNPATLLLKPLRMVP